MFVKVTIFFTDTDYVIRFDSTLDNLEYDNRLSFLSDYDIDTLKYDVENTKGVGIEFERWYCDETIGVTVKPIAGEPLRFMFEGNGIVSGSVGPLAITQQTYRKYNLNDFNDFYDFIDVLGVAVDITRR